MTPILQRLTSGVVVCLCLALPVALARAADTSAVGTATREVERGARQAGEGIEQTARGVGKTVVEGARMTGEKIEEAAKEAQPQVENTWDTVKHGAAAAGTSVKRFFRTLFGN